VKAQSQPDDHALVVGVARYDPGSNYQTLRGSPYDCRDFARWLIEGAGVPARQVHSVVWSSSQTTPYPNESNIKSALSRLLYPRGALDPPGGRRLYLFSAGHCEASGTIDVAVVTAEARPPAVIASFPITHAAYLIRKSGLFREIVLFVDGCRSISGEQALPYGLKLPRGPHDTQILYAFACEHSRPAYEGIFGGRYRGVFSRALMLGLRGEAADGKKRITGESLERFLHASVTRLRAKGQDQVPEVYCPKPFTLF
jgi:hypothetical protein